MSRRSPSWAAEYAERAARHRLEHERCLNAFIERRRHGIRPTARYAAGPIAPNHPRFGSELDYLNYLAKREMGKYDDEVDYPTS